MPSLRHAVMVLSMADWLGLFTVHVLTTHRSAASRCSSARSVYPYCTGRPAGQLRVVTHGRDNARARRSRAAARARVRACDSAAAWAAAVVAVCGVIACCSMPAMYSESLMLCEQPNVLPAAGSGTMFSGVH